VSEKVDTSALVAHLQTEFVGLHEKHVTDLATGEFEIVDTHPVRSEQIRKQLAGLGADVPTIEGEEG
jgi:hypothetical protein